MRVHRTLAAVAGILAGVPVAVVGGMFAIIDVELWLGYFPGGTYHLAETAASQRNVTLCRKILDVPWNFILGFGPPAGQMRADCIHEYATLTKDPSACKLLMPSAYGLDCVGEAEKHDLPCNTNVNPPYSVFWMEDGSEHFQNLRECMRLDPSRSALGNQCCQVAQVAFLKNHDDCSPLAGNPPVHDRCLYELAWKLRDARYCDGITNANARAACDIQTKALKQNPSICHECIPPPGGVDEVPKDVGGSR